MLSHRSSAFALAALLVVSLPLAACAETNEGMPGGEISWDLPLRDGNALVYANYIDTPDEMNNTISILTAGGFTVATTTTTDPGALAGLLEDMDVFVVPELFDDHWPDAGELAMLATTFGGFAPVLDDFMSAGHNVLVLEGDASCAPGEVVVNAIDAATIAWEMENAPEPYTITLPGDPMADGLGYIGDANGSGSYSDTGGNLTEVIHDAYSYVIASHAAIGCGNFLIVGFDYFSWSGGQHDILLVNAASFPTGVTPATNTTWGAMKSLFR